MKKNKRKKKFGKRMKDRKRGIKKSWKKILNFEILKERKNFKHFWNINVHPQNF